jgi:hypothetical protein
MSHSQLDDSNNNAHISPPSSIWFEIYRPLCCSELWYNKDIGLAVKRWLSTFEAAEPSSSAVIVDSESDNSDDEIAFINNYSSAGLLLVGDTGCGKTSLAHACATEQDMLFWN